MWLTGGGRSDYSVWLDAVQIMVLFKHFCKFLQEDQPSFYLLRLEDIYGCPHDFIEVFDGQQAASLSLGRFCAGAELTFLSSTNIMTAVFRSDAMITNTGFHALYNAIQRDETERGRFPNACPGGKGPFPLGQEMLSKPDWQSLAS